MELKRKRSDIDHSFSRLCKLCEALLRTPESIEVLLNKKSSGIRRNFGEYTQSMKDGCSLCSLILQSLEVVFVQFKPSISTDITIRIHTYYKNVDIASKYPFDKILSKLQASIPGARRNETRKGSRITLEATKGSLAAGILGIGDLLDYRYWESDEFFYEVQNQLDCCWGLHKSCPPKRTPILPTRVIDVGDENLPGQVKLHIATEGETAPYIALSYCWGGDQRVKTTKDTLASKIAGLEVGCLPQTIQDAITITRGLKVRYLWIDVLCIIQDDKKDKEKEIEGMGQIYKSASLTILAAAPKTAEEGFLQTPDVRIPIYTPSGEIAVAVLRLPGEPLHRRGWTFQEELLSPRKLYFGDYYGVRFKCPSGTYLYDGYKFSFTGTIYFPGTLPHTVFTQRKSGRSLGKGWADIIEYYSSRRLTNPEDRLPALAGIAKEYHGLCNSNYWAGMWEKFGIRHLGWRSCTRLPTGGFLRINLEQIQRPTWSWVSLLDKFEEPYTGWIRVDEVMEESTKIVKWPMSEGEKVGFGQVTGGRLLLQGQLVTFLTPPRAAPNRIFDDWGVSIYYEIGVKDPEAGYQYLLLGFTAWKSAVGLVLIPDEHDEDGAYLRVGQFRISAKAWEGYSREVESREIVIA